MYVSISKKNKHIIHCQRVSLWNGLAGFGPLIALNQGPTCQQIYTKEYKTKTLDNFKILLSVFIIRRLFFLE